MLSIIPRDRRFFDLFEQAAGLLVRASQAYVDLLRDYQQRERWIAVIRQIEHEGDEITHETLKKLDTTFITPFDREDIYSLMKTMDDVVDEIDAASKRLILYQIPEPKGFLVKQVDVLLRACQCVASAVGELRHHSKKIETLRMHLIEIHAMENAGDDINHAAAADLYTNSTNAIEAMKWKEIFDLTERAIDRCEDVANIIDAIILKNS